MIVLAVLALVVMVAFAAAPVALASATTMASGHTTRADDLVKMLVSGATLLGVASAVRRYVP